MSINAGRKLLDHLNIWLSCLVTGLVNGCLTYAEWQFLGKSRNVPVPTWIASVFFFAAFMTNMAILDWIFYSWAKMRFDMYVQSGIVRRSGARYERGIHVRMEQEDYFIPVGQELVLRNSASGNAQVVTAQETAPQS